MSPEMQAFLTYAPIGFAVGAYGTLVGAGGGSVLVPVLLFMLPGAESATVTAISLAVVFFNAYSGTIAYIQLGRVDYRAGTLFAVAGVPGAILGALLVHDMPRWLFDPVFGTLLVVVGVYLFASPLGGQGEDEHDTAPPTDTQMFVGSVGSGYIAVLSSLLGIGGGIIHVPFLIRALRMPPHTATATSHFVLSFMALTGTVTHIVTRAFEPAKWDGPSPVSLTMYLAVGVMMGAPLGAAVSTRMKGSFIVRALALALCLVGLRLLATQVWPH
jgi:uncharacterized membrane protein YfcA